MLNQNILDVPFTHLSRYVTEKILLVTLPSELNHGTFRPQLCRCNSVGIAFCKISPSKLDLAIINSPGKYDKLIWALYLVL